MKIRYTAALVAIAAANVADRIDEQARPIRAVMEEVIKTSAARVDRNNPDTRFFLFVDWLLSRALHELDAQPIGGES